MIVKISRTNQFISGYIQQQNIKVGLQYSIECFITTLPGKPTVHCDRMIACLNILWNH